ncbi:MAG: hypothetical protein WKG07_13830 [Hymenobacter sp.]
MVQYHRDVARRDTLTWPAPRTCDQRASRDSLRGVYTVRFTRRGAGQGDYVLSTTDVNANGRVYEYAGRQTRATTGRCACLPYAPAQADGHRRGQLQLDPTTAVFVDLATSRLQRNRFDSTGASQRGGAMRLGYTVQDRAPAHLGSGRAAGLPPALGPGLRVHRARLLAD